MNMPIRLLACCLPILLLTACGSSKKASTSSVPVGQGIFPKEYTQVPRDSMRTIMARPCPDRGYEFTDLYASPQALPDEDQMLVDDPLKARGFTVINTGRSNWEKGPRIVSMTLEITSCVCEISKRYHTTPGVTDLFRVTETVECRKR